MPRWHTIGTPRRMPTAAPPDLAALKNAYKVLGVDYSADPAAIRQAHKRLAKQHHPDRFPVGSAEQQQATTRMAAINDAYGLVRNAPLRDQRVSKAPDPPAPTTDTEFDDAVRGARVNENVDQWIVDVERVDHWMTRGLIGLAVGVLVCMTIVNVVRSGALRPVRVPQVAVRQSGGPVLMGSPTGATGKKISAQELESQLLQASDYFADAKLRCEPKAAGWDYICSYTRTDQTVFPRMQFGVKVDSKGVRQISQTVPFGVPIPPSGL